MNQTNRNNTTRKLIMNGVTSTMKNVVSMRDDLILIQSLLNSLSDKSDTDNEIEDLTNTIETSLDSIDEKVKTIAENMATLRGTSLEDIQKAVNDLMNPDNDNNSTDGPSIVDQFR